MTDSNPQNSISDPMFITQALGLGAACVTTLYFLYQSRYKKNSNQEDLAEDALNVFTARRPRKNK